MTLDIEHVSALCLGNALALAFLAYLFLTNPASWNSGLTAFPRHRTWGIALTAIALVWSAFLINDMTLGELSKYKWLLYILTPLAFYLIIHFLDELLAPRALGGLMMIYPTLLADAARWHDSPWRLVLMVFAYVLVIVGMWLMLCPFRFRTWSQYLMASPARRRLTGLVLISMAALLAIASWQTA